MNNPIILPDTCVAATDAPSAPVAPVEHPVTVALRQLIAEAAPSLLDNDAFVERVGAIVGEHLESSGFSNVIESLVVEHVERATEEFDIERAVESALDDMNIERMIEQEVSDLDLSEAVNDVMGSRDFVLETERIIDERIVGYLDSSEGRERINDLIDQRATELIDVRLSVALQHLVRALENGEI